VGLPPLWERVDPQFPASIVRHRRRDVLQSISLFVYVFDLVYLYWIPAPRFIQQVSILELTMAPPTFLNSPRPTSSDIVAHFLSIVSSTSPDHRPPIILATTTLFIIIQSTLCLRIQFHKNDLLSFVPISLLVPISIINPWFLTAGSMD